MKLYKIKNWNTIYENNRTRELKRLDWFPMPNKQDGDGYTLIMEQKDGVAIFGAWVACAQIASRCDPRGTLMRDGATPHDSASLSRMSRIPASVIDRMLSLLSSPELNWLEHCDYLHKCDNPAGSCDIPAGGCPEGKGREGNEEKGTEEKRYTPESRVALHYLNESSGKHFRECESSLAPINARLKEADVTIEGVKLMIARQCKQWRGTKMEEYLRPQTLFGKEKFDGYYAAREMPINTNDAIPAKKPQPQVGWQV